MSAPLRVAVIAPSQRCQSAGGGTANSEVAASLIARLPNLGVEVEVFRGGYDDGPIERTAGVGDLGNLQAVADCFEQSSGFDLIHNLLGPAGIAFGRFSKAPVLTTLDRDYGDWIATQSEQQLTALSGAYLPTHEARGETIAFGCEMERLAFTELSEGYLLWCGELSRAGGSAEAVQVALQLRRRLVLVGPAVDPLYFREVVAPHIGRMVEYLAEVPDGVRPALIGGAAALLIFDADTRRYPVHAIEAMICGTPVAAAANPVTRELIDVESGSLAHHELSIADAVKACTRLDRHEVRLHALERFDAATMTQSYLDLYQRILSATARASRVNEPPASAFTRQGQAVA